jgi:hypothetical protein
MVPYGQLSSEETQQKERKKPPFSFQIITISLLALT